MQQYSELRNLRLWGPSQKANGESVVTEMTDKSKPEELSSLDIPSFKFKVGFQHFKSLYRTDSRLMNKSKEKSKSQNYYTLFQNQPHFRNVTQNLISVSKIMNLSGL